MSRTSARFLTALLGVWLLLDAGNRATISHAQDADFGIFFLRLIESAPAKGDASPPVLVFAVKPEGQAVLMVTSRAPADPSSRVDESDVIWQQTGTLSRIELNLLKTAVGDLAKIPDQHWPDKDYALDLYPIEDLAASKRLLVSSAMKPGSAADRATLDNAMRTILKVRKRFEPLVVFKWFGGFRRRASRLTIRPDGALTYEDLLRRTNVAGTVTQSQLDLVLRQIHNATSLALPPVVDKTCADCWAYSLLTLSDDGLKTADFDQVALEGGPQSLKTLVRLLADLSDEEA